MNLRRTACLALCMAGAVGMGLSLHGEETDSAGPVRFYRSGTEPPPFANKAIKPERLTPSPHMPKVNLVQYSIEVILDTDTRIDQKTRGGESGWSNTRTDSGDTRYRPRIGLSAKNHALPKGGLLVIEYFSRVPSSKVQTQRECVEHITLPEIAKGELLTVDAEGIELYKYEHKSQYGLGYKYERSGGLELFGVICSLFQDGELVLQVCTSTRLVKECSKDIPKAEAPKEQQGGRHYFM